MHTRFARTTIAAALLCLFTPNVYAEDTPSEISETTTQKSTHQASTQKAALDEVVVTATGFEQKAAEAPASITVLRGSELAEKSYRDVTDALKDVPGVVVTGGGSSTDISIRGMGSSYTMILVDGKRVNSRGVRPNSDGSGIEQGWITPITGIQRIEVIRGPASALYGSDAMGGVINIITKKTSSEWTGAVKADATIQQHSKSGNSYQGALYVSGPIIKDVLGITANAAYQNRAEDKFIGGYNRQRIRNGNVILSYTPNLDNTIDFEYKRTLQDRDATVGKTIDPTPINRRGTITQPTDSETLYDRTEYSVMHTGYYDRWNTKSYIQREENDNAARNMFETNTIFNTQNQIRWNDIHTSSVGGRWQREHLKDSGNQLSINGITQKEIERDSWALFGEHEWKVHPKFALTGAMRYDHDENYGSQVTPKLYGVWMPSENWIVKGGVATGYKTPALRQSAAGWGQATGGGRNAGMIAGNPNLKPEKSTNVELGFSWDNKRNFSTGLTVYHTQFKDKITEVRTCAGDDVPGTLTCSYMGENFDFVSQRENVDKATLMGAEAVMNWKITPDLNWSANYTFTKTEQKSGQFAGRALNNMPRHMFNTTLDWEAHEKLNLWSRLNFRGRTSEYLSRTSMSASTPSYAFVDVGLNYRPTKNLDLSAGIYNVGDKQVTRAAYGRVLEGRRYNIGATYRF